ncbi:hypothetical protein [Bythopirellula goksoeyrii]|nr:hypothetical protein [Bythopirellula goksoeyrii]
MMALIAVLLALYVTNRPYSPTAFISTLEERSILATLCADLSVPIEFGGTSIGSGNSSWSGGERESSLILTVPDIKNFQEVVMPRFREYIERKVRGFGGTIVGQSQGGTNDGGTSNSEVFKRLQQFSFLYRIKGTRGAIRVYSFEHSERQLRILILVDEH